MCTLPIPPISKLSFLLCCYRTHSSPYHRQQILGCICSSGFTGPDCSQAITPGSGLWEVLSQVPHPNTSRLARMGHTMVHTPGVLLVYAGYSLTYGLLNDLQSYNLSSNTWSLVEVNQLKSSLPSARYLHSAMLHTVSKCEIQCWPPGPSCSKGNLCSYIVAVLLVRDGKIYVLTPSSPFLFLVFVALPLVYFAIACQQNRQLCRLLFKG